MFGCTTDWALNFLGIETYVDEEKYMQENGTEQKVDFFIRFGTFSIEFITQTMKSLQDFFNLFFMLPKKQKIDTLFQM